MFILIEFVEGLWEKYQLYRKKKYWKKQQMHHLRMLILDDRQWLASDPTAQALTNRYLRALDPDWYTQNFEEASAIRERLEK